MCLFAPTILQLHNNWPELSLPKRIHFRFYGLVEFPRFRLLRYSSWLGLSCWVTFFLLVFIFMLWAIHCTWAFRSKCSDLQWQCRHLQILKAAEIHLKHLSQRNIIPSEPVCISWWTYSSQRMPSIFEQVHFHSDR